MLWYGFGPEDDGWQEDKLDQLVEKLDERLPSGVRVVDYSADPNSRVRILFDDVKNNDDIVEMARAIYQEVMGI